MVIWTGCGIINAFVGYMCFYLTALCINVVMRDRHYCETHRWTMLFSFWLTALVSWWVSRMMYDDERKLPDAKSSRPADEQPVDVPSVAKPEDSFFFIPVRYWWIVFLVLGVVSVFPW